MAFLENHLLTFILFTPVAAAVLLLFVPRDNKNLIRWVAFIASFIPFILSMLTWFRFDSTLAGFQFEEKFIWYGALNSSFHLGIDGISLSMVLLTTLLTPLAILAPSASRITYAPIWCSSSCWNLGCWGCF